MKYGLINVDMDGVVYDFERAIRSVAESEFGRPLPPASHWYFWEDWGLTESEWHELFEEAVIRYEVFATGGFRGAAKEALEALSANWRIRFVTNKQFPGGETMTATARLQTVRFLHENGLSRHELAFASDKVPYVADVIIDDKPDLSWRQQGKFNILFDAPWNENTVLPSDTFRAYCWDGVLDLMRQHEWSKRVAQA